MFKWNHLLENESQFFFRIKKIFNCQINSISQFNRSQKNHQKKKKTTNQFWNEINIDQKFDSKFQAIDFTDKSNQKANRAFYNKTSYVQNAMIILIINKVFSNNLKFRKINSKNVIAVSFLYYLMSNSKKKKIIKQQTWFWIQLKTVLLNEIFIIFRFDWIDFVMIFFNQKKIEISFLKFIQTKSANRKQFRQFQSNLKKKSESSKKNQFVDEKI